MTTATEPSRQPRHGIRTKPIIPGDPYDQATLFEGAFPLALIIMVAVPFLIAGLWSWLAILNG